MEEMLADIYAGIDRVLISTSTGDTGFSPLFDRQGNYRLYDMQQKAMDIVNGIGLPAKSAGKTKARYTSLVKNSLAKDTRFPAVNFLREGTAHAKVANRPQKATDGAKLGKNTRVSRTDENTPKYSIVHNVRDVNGKIYDSAVRLEYPSTNSIFNRPKIILSSRRLCTSRKQKTDAIFCTPRPSIKTKVLS